MAIGPVQLIVLGFSKPDFHGEIIAELERLRASDTVRVIDSLAVYKDADGELEVEHLSNLSEAEAIELGSKIGALIGLGIDGEAGARPAPPPARRRQPPTAACTSSPSRRAGMSSKTSRTTPPRRSSCSSITGRCRCATRSPGPGASGSATGSSARSTWWSSGWSRPRRRRNCTNWKRRPRHADHPAITAAHHHEQEARDVRSTQSSPPHLAAHRTARFPPQVTDWKGNGLQGPHRPP